MTIDIQAIINDKVTEMLNEGVITESIQGVIEKSVKKCVEDSITSWDVTGLIRDKMKKEISSKIEEISFEGYTQHVVDTVLDLVSLEKERDITDNVRNTFRKMFVPNKNEYTIEKIVDAFADYMNTTLEHEDKYDLHGKYYAQLESSTSGGYWKLILAESEEAAKNKYHSSSDIYYEILIHRPDSKKTDEYQIFLVYNDNGSMTNCFNRTRYNEFEQLLINIYLHRNIIRDDDICADYSSEYDCYADIEY